MIAVQVFVGLVLFAAFLGLLVSAARVGRAVRSFPWGQGLREVSRRRLAAISAASLAFGAVAVGVGWVLGGVVA